MVPELIVSGRTPSSNCTAITRPATTVLMIRGPVVSWRVNELAKGTSVSPFCARTAPWSAYENVPLASGTAGLTLRLIGNEMTVGNCGLSTAIGAPKDGPTPKGADVKTRFAAL